jgi:endonuclease-8
MPEGDTIARTARRLHEALAGRTLTRFEAPRLVGAGPRPGTTIDGVDSRGKHLLIRFGDGRVLHTHMQMTGSWHVYRSGERWRTASSGSARARARVVLEVDDGSVAVCFSAPVVELLNADLRTIGRGARGGRTGGAVGLDTLGPDLCRADADLDEAVRRLGAVDPATEIAVALLDQRIAAGVGNVYKSEVCFACRVNPFTPVGTLDEGTRRELVETSSRLLRANLDGPRRTTVPGGLAVYGRAGRPCRRCGDRIRRARQGPLPRSTYWCPRCQPAPAPVQSNRTEPEGLP